MVLDWSNLMYRALFMNQLYGKGGSYDNIDDMRSFTYKFAMDVCSIINIFKPNNIIIATDSKDAWRKDLLPSEGGYKSNRKKDKSINWENIYTCSDELCSIFEKNGVHAASVERGEADDIAALVKEVVFRDYPNYNVIIVSADADIRQLMDFNPQTEQYCIVYNTTTKGKEKKRYIYCPKAFNDWLYNSSDFDFFEGENMNKRYIKNIIDMNSFIALDVYENVNDVVIGKIFCGDDGDCVPSFYEWFNNGKIARITPGKEKRIREKLSINDMNALLENVNNIKPIMEDVIKKSINDIDFNERMMRQRRLVELNSTLFPKNIADYATEISYMVKEQPKYGYLANMNAQTLLKDTNFEGYDKRKVLEADVFKDMDKYIVGLQKPSKPQSITPIEPYDLKKLF